VCSFLLVIGGSIGKVAAIEYANDLKADQLKLLIGILKACVRFGKGWAPTSRISKTGSVTEKIIYYPVVLRDLSTSAACVTLAFVTGSEEQNCMDLNG
jgi:hypothetical protein